MINSLAKMVTGNLSDPDLTKYENQNYDKIKKRCLKSKTLWVDPTFQPEDSSLWEGKPKKRNIEWKRPKEITKRAVLFKDGHCEDDVKQGELGNCWFVASVACFAYHEGLVEKVIPDAEEQDFTNEDYCGVFLFRFYRFGEWVEVVIDDLLPTYKGRLLFMHSNDRHEFWCALLEKAYAKLAGSYEALASGTEADALTDLTGGVSQYYEYDKMGVKGDADKEQKIFSDFRKALRRGALITCSMDIASNETTESRRDSGLVVGHAYTVAKCEEIALGFLGLSDKHKLIKIRNPWGDTEWNGKWKDDDPLWKKISNDKKKELEFTNEDDGEFWMDFHEFIQNFDNTTVCRLINTGVSLLRKKWYLKEIKSSWVAGVNAGGCANFPDTYFTNPQIKFEILEADDETVQICLCQRDRRVLDEKNHTIGFRIFKLPEGHSGRLAKKTKTVYKSKYSDVREVYARVELEVGKYMILLSTFNPNTEGDWLCRIFTEDEAHVKLVH